MTTKLSEEHMVPMMVVQERTSGDILSQVFNFIDTLGGKGQLTPAGTSMRQLIVRYRCGKVFENQRYS